MTGRTIPVTRTDGSEVASEATLENIKAKTDNLDIALSVLRDALRGSGNKTLTDLWNELASTLAVSDSTSHTTLASIVTALGQVATESTQLNIKAKTDNLDLALTALRDALLGSGSKTNTDIVTALGPLATDAKLEAVRALLAGILVVGGATADGGTPAAGVYSVMGGGKDSNGNKRTFLLDVLGYLFTKQIPQSTTQFSLGSLNAFQSVAVPDGYNSWSVAIDAAAVFSATVQFRYTTKASPSASDWIALSMPRQDAVSVVGSSVTSAGATVEGPIPSGATYVQVYVLAYTSGTATGSITISPRTATPSSIIWSAAYPTTSSLGYVRAPGIYYSESTTPVNAGLTITGSWRTTYNTNTGVAWGAGGVTYGNRYVASAGADVTGSLAVEGSPDSGTTVYPVSYTAMSQNNSTGNYAASVSGEIGWAYMRDRLFNGGSNQTKAFLGLTLKG